MRGNEQNGPEVLFDVPLTEVFFLSRPTHKARVCILLNESSLYSMTCFGDTGAWPNLMNGAYPSPHWKCLIRCVDVHGLRAAREEILKAQSIFHLIVKMESLQVRT